MRLFFELHHPPLQLESDGFYLENKMAPGLEAMDLGLKSFPKDIRSQSLAVIQLDIEKAAHLKEKVSHLLCTPLLSLSITLSPSVCVLSFS